jgi:hypothetical protein
MPPALAVVVTLYQTLENTASSVLYYPEACPRDNWNSFLFVSRLTDTYDAHKKEVFYLTILFVHSECQDKS